MESGAEYKEIIIMTAVYSPTAGECNKCYYQDKGHIPTGNSADPCNICGDGYIFEKSVRLEKVIR